MRGFFAGFGVAAICLISMQLGTVGAREDASKPEFYATKVKPILDTNCGRCHEGTNHRGGLNMDTRAAMLAGGHHGPAIVAGDPGKSWMVRLIRHEGPADDPMNMPPKGDKLSDADIATVEMWIKAGAVMPPDAAKAQ